MPELLKVRGITKRFPGVVALNGVDLTVDEGEVHGLLGENGAGKSTLVKILAGAYVPDAGEVWLGESKLKSGDPLRSRAQGIAVIHQELMLAPDLPVYENVFLGNPLLRLVGVVSCVDRKTMIAEARRVLEEIGFNINPTDRVRDLSVASQQGVEIARALWGKSSLVIMDEPTALLPRAEVARLFDAIRKLKSRGVSVIYITHRLREIFEITDKVTVLRDGRVIGTRRTAETSADELILMMTGRRIENLFPWNAARAVSARQAKVVLEVSGLKDGRGKVKGASFLLRRGEILGVAGLVGSGKSELVRCVFGADRMQEGCVKVFGREARIRSPRQAIAMGISYLPNDRRAEGLFLPMAVTPNVSMPTLDSFASYGVIDSQKEKCLCGEVCNSVKLRAPGLETPVWTLSGGNQQKCVLARWLMARSKIMLMDEPTRGIDVGAKAEIYALIDAFASEGNSVVFVSSELPELLGVCDRIIVMSRGEVSGEFYHEDATEEAILRRMF